LARLVFRGAKPRASARATTNVMATLRFFLTDDSPRVSPSHFSLTFDNFDGRASDHRRDFS